MCCNKDNACVHNQHEMGLFLLMSDTILTVLHSNFLVLLVHVRLQFFSHAVVRRSIGIHLPSSAGGGLFECAEIMPFVKAADVSYLSITSSTDFDRSVHIFTHFIVNILFAGNKLSTSCA